ncbi:hypothetical protein EC988_009144 [Linderina pennispora]|nr:hypothetical protein EC988_009144 [Linderina pennispora]
MDKPGENVSENAVDAMGEILRIVTGNVGIRAQQLSGELAGAVDGSQTDRLSEATRLLEQASTQLMATKQGVDSYGHHISACAEQANAAKDQVSKTADELKQTLKAILAVDPAREKREQFQKEMQSRNRQFEEKLKAEHQEFVQRHAKRLTRILQ